MEKGKIITLQWTDLADDTLAKDGNRGSRNLRPWTDWRGVQEETRSDLAVVWMRK